MQQTSSSREEIQPKQMANLSAHRLLDNQHQNSLASPVGTGSASSVASTSVAALLKQHHQQHDVSKFGNRPDGGSKTHFRSHQRRQSVARLLPDISKLRLLSWLIEASSELINCDIAIMDGVYAKLNRSQESLLFWGLNSPARIQWSHSKQQQQMPVPPSVQPVANKIVISQRKLRQNKARNHHSLPLTNYDASSLAAVSLSVSLGAPRTGMANSDSMVVLQQQQLQQQQQYPTAGNSSNQTSVCSPDALQPTGDSALSDNNLAQNNEDLCDSNQSDDDDNSSAASSTTSSGINGGTSLSSASSSSSSASSSSSRSSSTSSSCSADLGVTGPTAARNLHTFQTAQASADEQTSGRFNYANSAEQLSEKIRRTVMEHNYLQSLLVNIIRQHDRQRDLLNQRRRRQMSVDQYNFNQNNNRIQQQRIDLADIADALDDGCLCLCHSQQQQQQQQQQHRDRDRVRENPNRSSTLPPSTSSSRQQQQQQGIIVAGNNQLPSRKVRRLKKIRANDSNPSELNKQDLINLLADKLCENCFETHYWLHGCSIVDEMPAKTTRQESSSSSPQDLNAIISKKNATFIKLVQQEVRSTISKSIELIDLIRKEIKSPESIKHKQLMRCFSTSIQLLTSVGNYVVPAQDISSFIPEVGQNHTTLFCLPSSDFDHLLLYPPTTISFNQQRQQQQHQQQISSNYHLASAPDIPIRRRFNLRKPLTQSDGSLINPHQDYNIEQSKLSSNIQRFKASDNSGVAVVDSSSGASSNNSSTSSSIARSTVQQSSLTRAQTASAILDGNSNHDLSFETIANLSRQQNEDDLMFQSRPKFWQSSRFNFIKKLLHVKQQRLLRQQSKDRRIYNNKVQNKFRLVMMDLTHFNKSQQLLTTENGVNSLLTSMRNVLEFGLYLTLKLY